MFEDFYDGADLTSGKYTFSFMIITATDTGTSFDTLVANNFSYAVFNVVKSGAGANLSVILNDSGTTDVSDTFVLPPDFDVVSNVTKFNLLFDSTTRELQVKYNGTFLATTSGNPIIVPTASAYDKWKFLATASENSVPTIS